MALRIKDINLDQERDLEVRQKKLHKKERNLSTSKRDRKVCIILSGIRNGVLIFGELAC